MLATIYYRENIGCKPAWKRVIFLSASIGLCCGIRVGGILVLFFFAILFWAQMAVEKKLTDLQLIRREFFLLLLSGITAYLIMLAFWPWAQESINNPLLALRAFNDFKWEIYYLFWGYLKSSRNTHWSYLPVWLGITTPILSMVLFISGTTAITREIWQALNGKKGISGEFLCKCYILLWAFFPICMIMSKKSGLYDGIRHVLFIFPALALIATEGILFWWNSITKIAPKYLLYAKVSFVSVLLLGFFNTAWTMLELHPYQTVYFNRIIGGLKGAHRKFDTDYWGNSLKEAALFLNQNVRQPAVIKIEYISPINLFYYLDKRFTESGASDNYDYVVTLTRRNGDLRYKGKPIFQVERQHVPLAIIKASPRESQKSP